MNASKKEFVRFASFKANALMLLVCISGVLVIILASNLEIFCFPKANRLAGISNEELFLIYSVVFTIINILLLKFSRTLEYSKFKMRTILFIIVLSNQFLIIVVLFLIYGQIKILSLYYNALFNTVIYASLISSAAFLTIAGIQFLRWFVRGRNYLVMAYGLVMLVLSSNSIIGAIYLSEVSVSHHYTIRYISCSVMMSALSNPNPEIINNLANLYDVTTFASFILAWVATVLMLKEYSRGKNKIGYWLIVIMPLIFFLSKYEVALYYFSSNNIVDILGSINVNSDLYGYKTLESILNSNLQLGGVFFGIAFFAIASKLTGREKQRRALMLTGIGIMFLFASKNISTLIISSYPPLGAVSVAFTGLASYMVYLGIYATANLTSRDNRLRGDLREKVERNMMLLKSIASSQSSIETEKNVKQLMNLTTQWQDENDQRQMTQEEIREVVNEVISELKTNKK